MMNFSRPITALLASLVLLSSATAEDLTFAGDLPTTRAFMADLINLYGARGEGTITQELTTATDALRRAASGEIDLGGTARPGRQGNRQEVGASMYPIVWDALVVIGHRDSPINDIGLFALQQVYAGEVTNWEQLGGPDAALELVRFADDLDGINTSVAEMLLGRQDSELASATLVDNLQAMGEYIASNPMSIGIATYSAARRMQVKILSVEGRSASVDSIQSGDYLLYTPLYLAIRERSNNSRAVKEFLKFASSPDAKRILRRNGVVPYTDGLALVSRQLDRAQMFERLRRAAADRQAGQ